MNYETIILKKEAGVSTITLNRPPINSFSPQLVTELNDATKELGEDNDTGVVVVTGSGQRGFSVGWDLKAGDLDFTNPMQFYDLLSVIEPIFFNLRTMPKPTIAAVNGDATAGGAFLALACDMRIAAEHARFRVSETHLGLMPTCLCTYFLPQIVGVANACELIFTSKTINAREAERIGLVNHVVPIAELESASKELATTLANLPRVALALIKRSIYQNMNADMLTVMERDMQTQSFLSLVGDFKEGHRAFVEKRKPVFKSRLKGAFWSQFRPKS